jgi:hypothetical protein
MALISRLLQGDQHKNTSAKKTHPYLTPPFNANFFLRFSLAEEWEKEEIKPFLYFSNHRFSGNGSTSSCLRYSCQHVPWKNFRFSKSAVSMFIPQYLQSRPQLNKLSLHACLCLFCFVGGVLNVHQSLSSTVG